MRIIKDLTEKRFGRLTAIEPCGLGSCKSVVWRCICDCGAETFVPSIRLSSGKTKSCGCLSREKTIDRNKSKATIFTRGNRLYRIYWGMKTRCYNTADHSYKYYGSRGITMCDEWKNSFVAFRNWALSHGYKPHLTIDRINNDGNYEPDNCRWATGKEQANNRRNGAIKLRKPVIQMTLDGTPIKEWKSIAEAMAQTNICKIGSVCKGERNTAGGYKWKYKEVKINEQAEQI